MTHAFSVWGLQEKQDQCSPWNSYSGASKRHKTTIPGWSKEQSGGVEPSQPRPRGLQWQKTLPSFIGPSRLLTAISVLTQTKDFLPGPSRFLRVSPLGSSTPCPVLEQWLPYIPENYRPPEDQEDTDRLWSSGLRSESRHRPMRVLITDESHVISLW